MLEKKWLWKEVDKKQVEELANEHNISPFIAELLIKRGISSKDVPAFLNPKLEDLYSPFNLKDMEKGVERIIKGVEGKEKILIFGDYDVDGITSTAVLYCGLKELGGEVSYYIPNREEGYGLNKQALAQAISQGVSLIITVDCGITALEEVQYCNEQGVNCIITDHHLPPEVLPPAFAIINPKQEGCNYPFKELAGVGLAFKLITALYQTLNKVGWEKYLDMVALGTVADLVPLLGENRTIVSLGLKRMNEDLRMPLKKLAEVAGVKREIEAYHLGFVFGPRLNAAGRLESPKEAIQLLLAEDEEQAWELAKFLDKQNKGRQEVEQRILEECIQMVDKINLGKTKVLVLASEEWHHGVIGIVASRLVEKYHRPVILLAIKGEEANGSCRSIEGFHIHQALTYCEELLIKYGGHAMAAGLTINKSLIDKFREKINSYAVENNIDNYLIPKLYIDTTLDPNNLDLKIIGEINKLKPFGQGNPPPVFRIPNLKICKFSLISECHLKIDFKLDHMWLNAIGFKKGDLVSRIYGQKYISVAGYLEENTFNGNTFLQMKFIDLKKELKEESLNKRERFMEILDFRKTSLKEYLKLVVNLGKKYLLYTNGYYKKKLEKFYLEQKNVIIKEYGERIEKGIPIFLHPSFKQRDFLQTVRDYENFGVEQIIIAFKEGDVPLLPDRDFLVALYSAIKKLNNEGKLANINNIKFILNDKFSVDYLIDRGLNIFSECNLIYLKKDCWFLSDVQEKVDYQKTATFQKYLKQQQLFYKWHQFALNSSLEDLLENQQFIIEEDKIWI
ncbi:single-stranded-DNA-specific exonuclease [Anaerobranca californiensis DSM 14826]|uniref:Single-stranded-DNA-specific exonuclease RecJ n=1 Tax=Anaerobranca californiensis DSM 14826 TaxID=1120989 RepID=A0A1M6LN40_9FIRM|nr:single-stranded-DNA-specific exonuclease RecJ [Anaerobranca californiensis]SHJ72545.1 single-stranded-DNA-specific exonuclease [Anaerobranca californiensis DSM 14826]